MKDWDKIIEQKAPAHHEKNVLAELDSLLDQNAALAADRAGQGKSWLFWIGPFSAVAVGAVAFIIVSRAPQAKQDIAVASPMLELAVDYELITDLREIQYLDELQKLGDSPKWKSRKSGTKKL